MEVFSKRDKSSISAFFFRLEGPLLEGPHSSCKNSRMFDPQTSFIL